MSAKIFDTVLKNVNLAAHDANGNWRELRTDIGVCKQKVHTIGDIPTSQADTVYHLDDLTLLPGLIDTQVHFREPGMPAKENLESGTRSALLGGITGVFEMPNTMPATTSAQALSEKLSRAKDRSWVDYAFYMGASPENAEALAELERLPGCCGTKVFMGSSTGTLLVDSEEVLKRIMSVCRRRVAIHSEDEARLKERSRSLFDVPRRVHDHPLWRDEESAIRSTERAIRVAQETGFSSLHVLHISTREELSLLKKNKSILTFELTPQHLNLQSPDCYDQYGSLAQMNPPIRDESHQQALWQALASGEADVMGSDHAPHTLIEKLRRYPTSPSGMPGVQTMVPLMLNAVTTGRMTLRRLVEVLSYNPAQIFQIHDRGYVDVGSQATFTVVNLQKEQSLRPEFLASRCGWSPFVGKKIKGAVEMVFMRGKLALHQQRIRSLALGQVFQFKDTM